MENIEPDLLFYRYDYHLTSSSILKVNQVTFRAVKETKCGYWIVHNYSFYDASPHKRWVSKTSKKRYAYPTIEEAKIGFISRCERHLKIIRSHIPVLNAALAAINDEKLEALIID